MKQRFTPINNQMAATIDGKYVSFIDAILEIGDSYNQGYRAGLQKAVEILKGWDDEECGCIPSQCSCNDVIRQLDTLVDKLQQEINGAN